MKGETNMTIKLANGTFNIYDREVWEFEGVIVC